MNRRLALITTLTAAVAIHAAPKPNAIHFKADFNNQSEARLDGQSVAPTVEEGVEFVADGSAAALKADSKTNLTYDLGAKFPGNVGSLELRFRPEVATGGELPKTRLLAIKGKRNAWVLEYNPNGEKWEFAMRSLDGKRLGEVTLWHGCVKPNQWNHAVLAWSPDGVDLFLDGKWRDKTSSPQPLASPVSIQIETDADVQVWIDELALHDRALTESQAAVLRGTFDDESTREAGIAEKFAQDDAVIAERQAMIDQLKGKVGQLLHRKNSPVREIKLPEGIVAEPIRPQDIGKIDLSKFKVIFFPKGPRYEVEPEQYPHIVEYVENGGGYVGSCQGSFFAHKLKLLNSKAYTADVWGIFAITLEPSPITDWKKGLIHMHFGNGPIMVPGEGCEIAARYVMSLPGEAKAAAIVTAKHGKGRVVLFGPHPTGGKVSRKGTRAFFSGKDLGTERMLVNALIYAAGISDLPREQ